MKSNLYANQSKKQFIALCAAGAIVFAGFTIFRNSEVNNAISEANVAFSQNKTNNSEIVLSDFDPNELDEGQWEKLGFSKKQTATILKYKNVIGGEFKSKEQLKKCYAISQEKYGELEPFILLPEKKTSNNNYKFKSFANQNINKKGISVTSKFNPDVYSQSQWEALGFSERQAAAIIKYKNYLGGSFISKEKFKECFIISDENYAKLSPYLILPQNTPENFSSKNFSKSENLTQKPTIRYNAFDPNLLDFDGWKALGFSEKQSEVILNYKNRNLKGSFKNLEELKACFVISDEKFEEMKPFVRLNPENFVQNDTQNKAQNFIKNTIAEAKTDFSKIDINQITYRQLIEFGFDEKSAGMLIGFRKKLGGFASENQILETYDIDKEMAQKLVSTAKLNTSGIEKFTLVDAPEEWLKNHPYFKYSADKIIYYRISNPDEKKIWKFIKVKPEYEAKMRLYLK